MAHHSNSKTRKILMFIREHPEGIERREIIDAATEKFPEFNASSIDRILAYLRDEDLIYNDGGVGPRGALWVPVKHDGVQESFIAIAAELAEELEAIHYAAYEIHLARRLQEIFGK
jgi:hypothetical protein